MEQFARLSDANRAIVFQQTAARLGFTNAMIVEKDFWVCWTLGRLYAIQGMPRLLFKGGTSLSKCFELIKRFSEDIDLGLMREDIGLDAESMPSAEKGSTRQKRARKALVAGTKTYVKEQLMPLLLKDFTEVLGDAPDLRLESSDKESVINFHYPRALDTTTYGEGAYIASVVRLEIGARSDHYPIEEVPITPYVADHFPDEFQQATCVVRAQAPERTLLEKALILHTQLASGRMSPRSSRHAYDLSMMLDARIMDRVTLDLFEEVALHKRVFGDDKLAGQAPEQGIRMVPEGEALRALETDYRNMEEMFFQTPPAFGEIAESLRVLEDAINSLSSQS